MEFSGGHALEEFIECESRAAAAKLSVEEEGEAFDWASSNFFFASARRSMPMPDVSEARSDSGLSATRPKPATVSISLSENKRSFVSRIISDLATTPAIIRISLVPSGVSASFSACFNSVPVSSSMDNSPSSSSTPGMEKMTGFSCSLRLNRSARASCAECGIYFFLFFLFLFFLDRLIGLLENLVFARVSFAIDPDDEPIPRIALHRAFKRYNERQFG